MSKLEKARKENRMEKCKRELFIHAIVIAALLFVIIQTGIA